MSVLMGILCFVVLVPLSFFLLVWLGTIASEGYEEPIDELSSDAALRMLHEANENISTG